ncbi:hypothetical protein FACS189425_10270 [Clostridia bacterium]|nr:hypothetical protein FACS189425_10270 [Clostridia bacterium]
MEKKKFKFNWLDALILVLVLAAAAFVLLKVAPRLVSTDADYTITLTIDEARSEVCGAIKQGDVVYDRTGLVEIGVVESVTLREPRVFTTTSEGKILQVERPGWSGAVIVVKGRGPVDGAGGIDIGKEPYYVNRALDSLFGNISQSSRISAITVDG